MVYTANDHAASAYTYLDEQVPTEVEMSQQACIKDFKL